jgi:hypothetical protein
MTIQKENTFFSYPVDELEGFRRMASFGYLVLAVASFVAMSFFIVHNLIGTEKPLWDENGFNWSIGQLLYAFIGVSFSFGFVVFTWFFYQTQRDIKARLFILLVAGLFPMFTEVGQMMNRTEDTRQEQATQSQTFKTIQKRVENAGTSGTDTAFAPLIASANAEKAEAETTLSQCVEKYKGEKSRNECQRKQEQAIAKAQSKIETYQREKAGAKSTDSSQLAQDTQTLHQLENDEGFLQPIVRLLMGLGLPALLASFAVSLIIIGSIEVSMSYLGGLLREIKEVMRAKGADISISRVKARIRETPIVSALHSMGEVCGEELGKAQTASEQVRRKMSGEDKPRPAPLAPENGKDSKDGGYTPRPALTVREALERVLALVTKGRKKGETFSIQEVQKAFEVVKTLEGADRVPAIDLEQITAWLNSKNRPTPSHEPSAEGMTGAEGTEGGQPSAEGLESAFLEWLEFVRAGQIKPTIKPSVRWISSRELVKGIKEIETLAYEWLERARVAGVIIHNPDRGTGKPLYVLA